MKLYNPITTITRKTKNGISEYFLHSVTLIDSNVFKSNGHKIIQDGTDLNVILSIDWDKSIEPMSVLSPVVHNVPLGSMPGLGTQIKIEVEYNDRLVGRNSGEPEHAEEDDKPTIPFIIG